MKRTFIIIALALSIATANAQVVRNGNTFSKAKTETVSENTKTQFTWSEGSETYPIYISKTGSCYILKVSKKTGKEYKKYLGPEVSKEICQELNLEYTPKNQK